MGNYNFQDMYGLKAPEKAKRVRVEMRSCSYCKTHYFADYSKALKFWETTHGMTIGNEKVIHADLLSYDDELGFWTETESY